MGEREDQLLRKTNWYPDGPRACFIHSPWKEPTVGKGILNGGMTCLGEQPTQPLGIERLSPSKALSHSSSILMSSLAAAIACFLFRKQEFLF